MTPPSATIEKEPIKSGVRLRSRPRRRRRRTDSNNDYDQASEFMKHFHSKHFHSNASRSLDAILEHPENKDGEGSPLFVRKQKVQKLHFPKAQSFSCLSCLAASSSFPDEANCQPPCLEEEDEEEWGFYFDDDPGRHLSNKVMKRRSLHL